MEPIRPTQRERIIAADPTAEDDLEEYERLLAERFNEDPDLPAAPAATRSIRSDRESRLRELHRKLFP